MAKRCFFSFRRERETQRPTGKANSLLLNKISLRSSSAYTCIMKFYCILQARRRERFQIFRTQRERERDSDRACACALKEKKNERIKGENKESYKCSFFKHFIVVAVIALSTGHEQRSCLAPCRRVTRNQFLFEEVHIKRIHLVPTRQSSRQFSLTPLLF